MLVFGYTQVDKAMCKVSQDCTAPSCSGSDEATYSGWGLPSVKCEAAIGCWLLTGSSPSGEVPTVCLASVCFKSETRHQGIDSFLFFLCVSLLSNLGLVSVHLSSWICLSLTRTRNVAKVHAL